MLLAFGVALLAFGVALLAFGVALLCVLGAPAPAWAHEGDPNIDTVILGVRPALPGIQVDVVQNIVPAISLSNRSSAEVQVLDRSGTPFLRIGPRGAEGNLGAAAFYRSAAPSGAVRLPPNVAAGRAHTRWARLSRRPAWAWYDDRVPNITSAPAAVRSRPTLTELARFTISLRLGTQPAAAEGEVEYVPPRALPVARLLSPVNPAPGVTVALLPGSHPDLYLQNRGPRPVTVLGQDGEPFVEIGPHGVRVNLRSPIHAADASARGQTPSATANPAARPLWRRVSSTGAYDWLDPRPRLQSAWSIPLLIAGRRLAITGTLSSPPALASGSGTSGSTAPIPGRVAQRRGTGAIPAWLIAVGVALVVSSALWAAVWVRRRVRI